MQTGDPYFKIRRGIGPRLLLASFFLLLLSSCAKDGDTMPDTPDGGGQCEATIRLNVGTFARNESTDTRSYVAGNSDENRINNIWIFQYDAETGASLHVPVYLDNFDSNDIDVTLTLNEGETQSLVCIVANVGEFVDAGEDTDTGDDTGTGGEVPARQKKNGLWMRTVT